MMDTYTRWQDRLSQLNAASMGGGSTPELNAIVEFRRFICSEVDAIKAKLDRLDSDEA